MNIIKNKNILLFLILLFSFGCVTSQQFINFVEADKICINTLKEDYLNYVNNDKTLKESQKDIMKQFIFSWEERIDLTRSIINKKSSSNLFLQDLNLNSRTSNIY